MSVNKTVNIICPLYNASTYIDSLHKSLLKQKQVKISEFRYVLTEGNDNTEEYLINNKINYRKIKKEEFSHSLIREKEAFESNADIVVFITQDVVIEDELWLYNLIKDIDDEEIVATYSRQLTKYNNLEKYTRESNYPDKDIIKSKNDIEKMRIKDIFL